MYFRSNSGIPSTSKSPGNDTGTEGHELPSEDHQDVTDYEIVGLTSVGTQTDENCK